MAFWIMLIWVFFIWYFFQENMSVKKLCPDGVYDYKVTTWFCILIFSVPFIFAAFRTEFVDTASYIAAFDRLPIEKESFLSVLEHKDNGHLFYGIEFYFKKYISDDANVFLGFLALVQSVLILKVFKDYSCDLGMSTFLFIVSGLYGQWMCNGIRQFTAVVIIFACTNWLLQKKWYFYLPVAIITMGLIPITSRFGWEMPVWYLCGIHQSVLIAIPALLCIQGKPFNKKVWGIVIVFVVLIITGGLDSVLDSSVENTTYVNDMKYVNEDTGTSIFRVLVSSIPAFLCIPTRSRIADESTSNIIKISANASIITSVLYIASAFTSGIYVGRLPIFTEMYNFILLPWQLKHGLKENSKMLMGIMIGLYLIYFYYQVSVVWKGFYQSSILGIGV